MSVGAGRFAPSPTGPLHLGSLLAATASFLDARAREEQWFLRIDDLDAARTVPESESAILRTLEAHALTWDGPVLHQSERVSHYIDALEQLAALGAVFYCRCSRKDLAGLERYPGTCRNRTRPYPGCAVRLRVPEASVAFEDLVAGPRVESLARTCGDFVVRRRDGLAAYQLATAIDDGSPAIVRVVRGGDLLDNTARQIHLMRLLGLEIPEYAHVTVLINARGQKLSKQTRAPAVNDSEPARNLILVLGLLGLAIPSDSLRWEPAELLAWATQHWSLEAVRRGSVVSPV